MPEQQSYVMVVESGSTLRASLTRILDERNVLLAGANVRDTIAFLKKNRAPKLIFVDLSKNEAGAWRLLAELQEDAALSCIPLAVATNQPLPREMADGLTVVARLSVPVSLEALLQTLEKASS